MKLGITGVHGSGKTTIFQLLTRGKLGTPPAPNDVRPHLASIDIPDHRVDFLSEVFKPKKTTYAKLELLDPPGFTSTSLALLRTADALIYVVPFFGRFNDPSNSLHELSSDLILRDSEILENAIKKSNSRDVRNIPELPLLEKCHSILLEGKPLIELGLTEVDQKLLRGYGFLTLKPVIIILNTGESSVLPTSMDSIMVGFKSPPVIQFNAKLELELLELSETERKEYASEFGIGEPPLDRFIRIGLPVLKVITFFTVKGEEVRAWQIPDGTQVIEAAGKVHSDMERGFIRAEVIGFDEFKFAGSFKVAKEKGLVRTVKQDYIVKDGDIIEIKFH